MDDAIRVEVGEGQSYVMTEIHLSVEGSSSRDRSRNRVKLSSINSIKSTGSLTQDHGMCPNIGQCVGVLWHSKDDTLAQTFT